MPPPDAAYVYEGLLGYNYLPFVKERRDDTPPLFTTEGLTPALGDQLIAHFGALPNPDRRARNKDGFDQIEYRTTRFNNVMRLMHIPHPLPFARLCRSLRDNWAQLDYICTNEHSQIKPERHADGRVYVVDDYEVDAGRVVVMEQDRFPDELDAHLALSLGASYHVDADVSGCFPSIYSHAIPWALVGHDVAKAQRDPGLWFNHIDAMQRGMKRCETQGVPVGPATSNIMNEVILARVDAGLADAGYRFVRHIDDYKCYSPTRETAEAFIRDLESGLSRFLLSLNARKVAIEPLPTPSKDAWVTALTGRLPRGARAQPHSVAEVLDAAIHLQAQYPEGSVVKYAARVLASKSTEAGAPLLCRYLLQLAFHYPIVLPVLCDVVKRYRVALNPDHLATVLARQLLFRRSDMVCWTLYLMHLCDAPVSDGVADAVVASGDCMSMAALLACGHHQDKVTAYVARINTALPYELDRHWLIIHQLLKAGQALGAPIDRYADLCGLTLLKDRNVSFLWAEE